MTHQTIYYENNKKEIFQQKRLYYLQNQEQLIENSMIYYTINRDKILTKNKRKLLCDCCQTIISYGNYTRHLMSNKHQNYILNNQ